MERIELIQITHDADDCGQELTFLIVSDRYEEEFYNEDDDEYYTGTEISAYIYKKNQRLWGDRSLYEARDYSYLEEGRDEYQSFFVDVDFYKRGMKRGRIKTQHGIKKLHEKRKRTDRSPPAKARKNDRKRARRVAR